ncbi:uncharacterized protein PF11_0213-like isoform X2 [Chrysoperla carnea]|uniref:uncharacterized protein PF11_0213-like isoform X2 n=1 Tax=Chrysoperla carnea TaxID=189513 RepID=UPI001D07920B|nr:uncharacterized protein PF11_0213-like isoform X2 [Chrysoperla carnea]
MLNLYSDEENFKTNHHYQPGEPKYELNCAPSKYLKATSARIISKIQDEINREPIIPSPPPRRQSLLRLPKTINGNIGTSRLIQELNSTASRMFQASLKNMHSVTNTRQDNEGRVRYVAAMPPKIVSKTVIEEYNPNKSSNNQYQTSPFGGFGGFDSPNKFSNNLVFPRESNQFVPKDKERNLSRKNTSKSIDERTFSNKVTRNENIMSNQYSKDDTKKSTPENAEDSKTVGTQYEQFYKNHLVNYENFQANFSKSSNIKINSIAGSDQNNDGTPQQSTVPEFESSVTALKKSTSEMVSKYNARFAKSENRKSTKALMKPQSQSLTNTALKFQSQPSTNNFIKPQSSTNFQYSGDGKSKFEEQKLPTQTNLRTNDKTQELLQNKVNVKNQELKQNITEYAMKETTSKAVKNISSEENKSPRKFLRRGNGPKPPISYAINVNKTAMVKEHLEKYSKRRLNMLGDKRRKEANSDGTKSTDIIQESTPAPIVNKKTDEYKMNITISESEKTATLVKPPQKTKSTSQSIQTQTMRPKVQKSASFVASNAKRDESIKLATSFNLPHTSRKTILESNQRKENMLNSELEFFSKETEKPLMGLSPRFIDLHDIEKNVNKPREEMSLNNKIKKTNESKRLVIDDFESGFGYDTSTSISTRKNPTSTQQFSVSSTSPYVTKLIDIPPSMHSPLIARKIHKVGTTSVKSLHHNRESCYAVNKIHNQSSTYKSHTRQIMTDAGRLRGGEDRINSTLERLLSKAQNLTKNLQNIRSQCQEYVEQLEKCNFESTCSCDSIQCTCNGLNFNQNANNNLKSATTRKHISRSTLRNSDYEFQNPCMEGPFSDILTRHFLPGNKGKMPAIVGYKTDGIPIYGPPGAAYNVMGWTRDGSPIFGRGGPGSKEPLLNIRGYFKTTPLYEPTDPEEKNKITQIGTYDNTPITGHRDLINGMVFVGKSDKGFGSKRPMGA